MKGFAENGRPLVSPSDNPADGIHPLGELPYSPSLFIEGGKPLVVQRHAAFPVTKDSVVRVLARLGWDVEACGDWYADAFSGDPCFQLLKLVPK